MSDLDKNKLPPERLTLSGIRNALIFSCCLAILFTVVGLVELKQGNKMYAGGFCLVALGQLFDNVPQRWKDYRQVKQGMDVYAPAQAETAPLTPVPKTISVTVVLILSSIVGVVSVMIVLAAYISFNTVVGWSVATGTLLFLWLLTAYYWYRIFTENPPAKPKVFQEQTEGVWPPAPLTADVDRNED